MPVELTRQRRSTGGPFPSLRFGDIVRGTGIAAFLRYKFKLERKERVCVCVCWGAMGAMGRDAASESNQHLGQSCRIGH